MRKLLLLLPCLIPLCGFAQAPFDANAVTKASAARKLATAACGARTDFKTSADVIDCVVAADSNFAHAIHLNDPQLLDEYVTGVKALDAGIVAGSIKLDDIARNFRALQDKFFKAMNDEYAEYQASLAEALNSTAGKPPAQTGMDRGMGMMDNMNGMNSMDHGMGN
jgi:hypothetical protein